MVTDLPWEAVIAALDGTSAGAASNAIKQVLLDSGEGASTLASRLAPMVKELQVAQGRLTGMNLLAPYMYESPVVRELIVAFPSDEHPAVRLTATKLMLAGHAAGDIGLLGGLFQRLSDSDENVRNTAIEALPRLAVPAVAEAARNAFYLLPSDSERNEALELLRRLHSAIHTLQDLGLDDAQHEIVERVITPTIAGLEVLLTNEMASAEEASTQREVAVAEVGRVTGAAQALAIAAQTTTLTANIPAAAANVSQAAEAFLRVVDSLSRYL